MFQGQRHPSPPAWRRGKGVSGENMFLQFRGAEPPRCRLCSRLQLLSLPWALQGCPELCPAFGPSQSPGAAEHMYWGGVPIRISLSLSSHSSGPSPSSMGLCLSSPSHLLSVQSWPPFAHPVPGALSQGSAHLHSRGCLQEAKRGPVGIPCPPALPDPRVSQTPHSLHCADPGHPPVLLTVRAGNAEAALLGET